MVSIKRKIGGPRPNSGGLRPGAFGKGKKPAAPETVETVEPKLIEVPMMAGQIVEISKGKNQKPKDFLLALMNNDEVDVRLRMDAARTLMPYLHQKIQAEKPLGKKEQKALEAKKTDKGSEWAALLQ